MRRSIAGGGKIKARALKAEISSLLSTEAAARRSAEANKMRVNQQDAPHHGVRSRNKRDEMRTLLSTEAAAAAVQRPKCE